MGGKKKKIDTSIPPHERPRPAHWPKSDVYARNHFSSVIPKFYVADNCWESKLSPASEYLLSENKRLLQEQRDEVSPVFPETKQDRRQAAQDATADMRSLDNEQMAERRLDAVATGTCDPDYKGTSKSLCDGFGCSRCSGQVRDTGDWVREQSNFDSLSSQIEEQRLSDLADEAALVTL